MIRRVVLLTLLTSPALADDLMQYNDYSKPPGMAQEQSQTPSGDKGHDFRYKVLFKLNVNYEFDDAQTSDAAYAKSLALNGMKPSGIDGQAAALNARADYISSDHVLGTEGAGWSHLRLYYNGFALGRLEGNGGVPSATFPTAYLTGKSQFAYDVRAGYGEIDGFKQEGFWSRVFLRAGRQWRYGAGVATYDGLTLGYRSSGVEISLWGGRRSPRFLGDNRDPGFVAGADAKLHLDAYTKVPVDLGIDYLVATTNGVHHMLLVDGAWRMRTGGRLIFSISSYDFAGMRGYLGLTHPVGRNASIKVYYDVKLGRDVTYDYISGFGFSAQRFFTMPDQEPRSRIGLRWDQLLGDVFEYALFANFNVVHGSPAASPDQNYGWTGSTAFDATYEELGLVARFIAGTVFQPEAEYRVRFTQRQEESGLFSSTSQAGDHQFLECPPHPRDKPVGTAPVHSRPLALRHDAVA